MGLVLAFDTATHAATVAVVDGERLAGERVTRAVRVLADAADLLAGIGAGPEDVDAVVVGTGPGSFTGVRLGIAAARGLALVRDVPVAGVSTLDALVAGAPGAVPVVDGGRREVFTLVDGEPVSLPAAALPLGKGALCVGDGALRYRTVLEQLGAHVPDDAAAEHLPHARLHVELARARGVFGDADAVEPIYVRPPDAKVPA